MPRLGSHGGGRQRWLFDKADVPELIPTIGYYAELEGRRDQRTTAAAMPWTSAAGWARNIGRLQAIETCSSTWRERFHATARSLTVARLRECRHVEDVQRIEKMLASARRDHGFGSLGRVWSKAELGELLVEARNRIELLELGRDRPRVPNERFALEHIPTERLEALIQRHPNMELVERLRLERQRRISFRLCAGSV